MEKDILYRYFCGVASIDEEKEIMDWAEASPENYKMYLSERKLWDVVLVNTPSEAEDIVLITSSPRKINAWMLTAVAASIALLFSLSYMLFHESKQDEKWQTVWVPPGQRAQIVLSDNTVVWLNSQSTLRYPASFNSGIREVQLNGEGYFDVMKNDKMPFIVKTSRYEITALGTSFNVFDYGDKSPFETSLIDGSVSVSSKNKSIPTVVLRPKEKVTEADGTFKTGTIASLDHFRWREGLICIDGEPLEKMMEKFSLYFDIHIKIENPALFEYSPTGKFRHSDGIDHALKVLQKDVKFIYTRDNEKNEIVIK